MRVLLQEEIFGPILSIISVKSLNEAIRVCNSVEYGLSSSIYTNDIANAIHAIEKIDAGITYVNSSTIGASAFAIRRSETDGKWHARGGMDRN